MILFDAAIGVGGHDGRPQRDVPECVRARLEIDRNGVLERVDVERARCHAAFETLESRTQPPHSRLLVPLSRTQHVAPLREMSAHHGRNPKFGSVKIRAARRDLPMRISALSGTTGEFATILRPPGRASCEATLPFSVLASPLTPPSTKGISGPKACAGTGKKATGLLISD